MPTFIKAITVKEVLAWIGVDLDAVVRSGTSSGSTAGPWMVVTNVSTDRSPVESGAFYKSVELEVDDPDKKAKFAQMINALFHAVKSDNYQAVLKGSNNDVKPAGDFKYGGATHKFWELKCGKKDRVYFGQCKVEVDGVERRFIVLLLACHKKDQTTPPEVHAHCRNVLCDFLSRPPQVAFVRGKK